MKLPDLTLKQSNALLAVAAIIFITSALLARLFDARISMWTSLAATIIFAVIAAKGYASRLLALVYSGIAILVSAWCAYGLWHMLLRYRPLHTGGIDPFAGPLSVLALTTCLSGLSIYMAGLWMITRRGMPFMQRFSKQRGLWLLGAALLFSFTYFANQLEGV